MSDPVHVAEKDTACPVNRLDVARVARVFGRLRPQPRDPHVHRAVETIARGISRLLRQLPARAYTIDQSTFEVFGYGVFIYNLGIMAALIATRLVAGLIAFSQCTEEGRARRAMADDHQAALNLEVGIDNVWVLVWLLAGIVALVTGIIGGRIRGCGSRCR